MKKVASILLTLLFLFSSSHLSFATHYCGGKAQKHGLTMSVKDFGCKMNEESNKPCKGEDGGDQYKKKCCDNISIEYSLNEDFDTNSKEDVSINKNFVVAFLYSSLLFNNENTSYLSKLCYSSPLLDKDIPVLVQSFLI